ncbi:MAG: SH3 domain-containing protein [Anaerolineales bacterium]|nr:SH3 domain-containing protein [Anaerolineales bacterium]
MNLSPETFRNVVQRIAISFVIFLAGCSDLANYNPYASLTAPTPAASATAEIVPTSGQIPTPSPTNTPVPLCTVTVSEALNLRAGAGTSYPVIGWLYPGDVLEVTQQRDGWDYVTTQNGRTGWVNSEFCR